ncbi:MAG: hypothetical protein BWK73_09810 [Thiothrix lacustris]|uniref:TIR domain-containing protein n=1 Tax=Thiothrix lacustris TaxID=525917 RepID=A0A1Y1QUS7_9GAMM|nr:MAG: hypothetical protein BWK73_09810 [Thiothrix lacustris]
MSQAPQVFISYARDGGVSEQTATALHEQLVQAGIAAFRDVENIDPGSHWAAVIEQQILASQLMVVVVSKPALNPQRWVMRECLFAANKRIPIIPVLVEQVDLPLWLMHINALDFTQTQHWGRLLLAVGKYMAVEPVIEAVPLAQVAPKPRQLSEAERLLQELQNPQVLPPRRFEIGNRLNIIGDPRPGVGLDANGLPDIDWVKIPAGEFIYQDGQRLRLDDYQMSRYPVTNQQFQAFKKAGGYNTDKWWEGLQKPDTLPSHRWTEGNRPVESVDWYESIAFCRWLSAKTGQEIRLPTEQEWEKAARGTDGREYPWEGSYKTGYANIDETWKKDGDFYLQETSAVGIYPQGQSPYGLMDMSGNVWEWCINKYEEPQMITPDLSGGVRVVRGGSWFYDTGYCRSSFRNRWNPVNRGGSQGFRLLCCFPH